jgi:hypothetical protein
LNGQGARRKEKKGPASAEPLTNISGVYSYHPPITVPVRLDLVQTSYPGKASRFLTDPLPLRRNVKCDRLVKRNSRFAVMRTRVKSRLSVREGAIRGIVVCFLPYQSTGRRMEKLQHCTTQAGFARAATVPRGPTRGRSPPCKQRVRNKGTSTWYGVQRKALQEHSRSQDADTDIGQAASVA